MFPSDKDLFRQLLIRFSNRSENIGDLEDPRSVTNDIDMEPWYDEVRETHKDLLEFFDTLVSNRESIHRTKALFAIVQRERNNS